MTETQNLPARFDASTAVARFEHTEAELAELAAKHVKEVFDVTSAKGLAVAKEVRKTFRDLRINIETTREVAKRDALEYGRALDSHAKKLQSIIADAEKNADDQIKAEEKRKADERAAAEKAEQEKIAAENALLDGLRDAPLSVITAPVPEIEAAIERVNATALDALTGHAHERGVMLKAQALEKLGSILSGAKAMAAEKARQAEQDAARAKEAAEAAQRKAEEEKAAQARAEAERKAAREKEDAERKERQAKEDAERAEQRRLDDEERARLKKEADELRAEQDRVNRLRLEQEERDRVAARKKAEADEQARIQKLAKDAPPLRRAAINALSLLTSKGLAGADESIQLKAAIEADTPKRRSPKDGHDGTGGRP